MVRLRLKELVAERGWTVNKLAKEGKLDYSVTYRYVHNTVTAYDRTVLQRLAEALGVEARDLFASAEEERKEH